MTIARDLAQRWLEESRQWAGRDAEDREDAIRSLDHEQPDDELLAEAREVVAYVRGATFPHRERLKQMGGQWSGATKAWMFVLTATAPLLERLQFVRALRSLSGVRVTLSDTNETRERR